MTHGSVCPVKQRLSLKAFVWRRRRQAGEKREQNGPGPSHTLVVVLRVHGQDGDAGADVDQQHGEGVVQGAGLLDAALRVRRVLEVVALGVPVEAHPVGVEQAVDQAVQLVQLQQLQVGHLQQQQRLGHFQTVDD